MYMPPGIVNDKNKKFSAEIRMAIPQDNIYLRKKDERGRGHDKDGKSSKTKSVHINNAASKSKISG